MIHHSFLSLIIFLFFIFSTAGSLAALYMARHAVRLFVVAHVRVTVGARAVSLFVIDIELRMAKAGILPIARVLVTGTTRARVMIHWFAIRVT